jgi:hypothetical protein
MSTFLGFESFKISLGASVQDVQDTFQTALSSYGWQIQRKSLIPIAYPTTNMVNYANAFNMVDNNYAGSVNVGSGILGIQLAATYTPTKMFITCGDGTQSPNTFVLEYSSDGNVWNVLQTWGSEVNWFVAEQRVYTVIGAGAYAYWRLRISSANSASLYIGEWALEDASGFRTTANRFFDVIPPSYEPIGNADAFDVLRLGFTSNSINFQSLQYSNYYTPQVISLWAKNAGAVSCAVTLNGATVSGSAGLADTSAIDNLRALYEAIKVSGNSNFTDWDWEWSSPGPQNSDDSATYIYGTKKIGAPWIVMSPNANVNGTTISGPASAQPQGTMMFDTTNTTIYTDLIDGFIYYLQVCSRSIALATKTTSSFYGPIHACYADHTKALAALPASGFALRCSPIELLVGWDDTSANSGAFARPSHVWAISNQTVRGISNTAQGGNTYDANWGTPFGRGRLRGKILDYYMHFGYYQNYNVTLFGSGMFSGGSVVGNDYQIHRVTCAGETIGSPDSSIVPVTPILDITDWYKFVGTSTDEALLLAADSNINTTASGTIGSADSIISVASVAGFQPTGFIVIAGEIIQYTSLSGNSFIGCVRGKYNTVAYTHFAGDLVCQGLWFTKINGGALLAGYVEPV